MIGPGKYDDVCTQAREQAKAAGAILIIFKGEKGNGFSVQLELGMAANVKIPAILRTVADSIESDLKKGIL